MDRDLDQRVQMKRKIVIVLNYRPRAEPYMPLTLPLAPSGCWVWYFVQYSVPRTKFRTVVVLYVAPASPGSLVGCSRWENGMPGREDSARRGTRANGRVDLSGPTEP